MLTNNDLLSCGPLPPIKSLTQWQKIREKYIRAVEEDLAAFSFAASDGDLLTNAAALPDTQRIVLWVGSGLAEQLLLAWVVQLLRVVGAAVSRLAVVQFSQDPMRSGGEVFGVGLLNLEGLRAHPPAAPLSDRDLMSVDAAWAAVTSPTPEPLQQFLSRPVTNIPLLQQSLARLLQRLPDAVTGLSYWDRELLQQVAERGPTAVRVIGFTMAIGMDTGDLVGDGYLFSHLRRMASSGLAHPLVVLSGETHELRGSMVELTDARRATLAGTLNVIEANGIDEWVAGTHLNSKSGDVWLHRGGVLRRY